MENVFDKQTALDNIENIVSSATKRNWSRLGVVYSRKRLSSRANKKLSDRFIIPKESFDNVSNVPVIQELAGSFKKAGYNINDVLFSLGINLLNKANVTSNNFDYLRAEYKLNEIDDLINLELPCESDILGLIYQCLQTEGEKNTKGSYYTPKKLVRDIVSDIKLKNGDKVLDPCCGSSIFLLNIPNIQPQQIYGIDIDPVAVMISKINYFLKFPGTIVKPKIYKADFLEFLNLFSNIACNYHEDICDNLFDYIITNPPWGAAVANSGLSAEYIKSNEIFSHFLIKSYSKLAKNGEMRFLLPSSILDVKSHYHIRKYLIEKTNLKEIKLLPGTFSGVMTQYICLKTMKTCKISKSFIISGENKKHVIEKDTLSNVGHFIIKAVEDIDKRILECAEKKRKYDLTGSVWALGIVTGDNKRKLFTSMSNGLEPIYTGKEIMPFKLKKAKYYIFYDRNNFQQAAKDEIYRAEKKLAYKFISKKLTFSIDNSSGLFLNSANILIPNIPNMSINSVAAFLNSELYQYLYQTMFSGIKILKSSLSALPFAEITKEQNEYLSNKVENILKYKSEESIELQKYIYNIFGLDNKQINHIKEVLYRTIN
ncbi:MAG: N-6 DNA methylase [Endomicrobium sp.]|jgi:predicted RNA methylase|nr:N-6 DNA methylase [Endomicrobium sp.]